MSIPKGARISRGAKVYLYPFTYYFKGFEKVEAVRKLFGEKTVEVLRSLKVEFGGRRGYMGVSDDDGHLNVSASYLNTGDITDIYLDMIHELVHVKQFMDGRDLFDPNYRYVNRPTEIEAYSYAVEEARRIGLSEERICEYLRTERIVDEDFQKLTENLHVKAPKIKGNIS